MPNKSLHDVFVTRKEVLQGEQEPFPLHFRIAQDIAEGLAYLHSRGMVHRDIKSLNILLDANWHAKIGDFGLVKSLTNTNQSSVSGVDASVRTVGSEPWMAPELLSLRPKYSEKSDVYAFGMVLWELWSGETPYQGVESGII